MTPNRQALESGRSLLRSYRARRASSNPRCDLEELCSMAESMTKKLDAAVNPSQQRDDREVVVELARALADVTTKRDSKVAHLETEHRRLTAENEQLRSKCADLERQLDQFAACFDSLVLCLGDDVSCVSDTPSSSSCPSTATHTQRTTFFPKTPASLGLRGDCDYDDASTLDLHER